MNLTISSVTLNKLAMILMVTMLLPVQVNAGHDNRELTERFVDHAKRESDNIRQQVKVLRKLKRSTGNKGERVQVEAQIDELRSRQTDLRRQLRHHRKLQGQGWSMVFSDEFKGNQLSGSNWSHEANCAGGGNNEQQCYTARAENSYVADGRLYLVAKEEAYSGASVFDDDPDYDLNDTSKTLPFTSARLRTKNKFDFKYGRVEVKAKVAGGQGMWPAIWMLPTDNFYGPWPRSGEIDILEAVNLGVGSNKDVHGTLHYGLDWPQWENHGKTLSLEVNPADDFHVYAIEWEADEIRWYFDDVHYQTQRSESWHNYIWLGQAQGFDVAKPRAPFDQNFHLILNLAVGGDWPGAPDTDWQADREMLVDYVRVYQCEHPRNSTLIDGLGEGCATIDRNIEVNVGAGTPVINDFVLYANGAEALQFDIDGKTVSDTSALGFWEKNTNSLKMSNENIGGDKGVVWQVRFGGQGKVFLTSENKSEDPYFGTGLVLEGGSGWVNHGELEFDMRITKASLDSIFMVKLGTDDSKLGQMRIEQPEIGQWASVSIRISDLMASSTVVGDGLDLTRVRYPFVLEYTGSAATVQIDNIRLQCAANSEPETWQQDKTCGVKPIVVPEKSPEVSLSRRERTK